MTVAPRHAASVVATLRTSLSLLATKRFGTFWFASLLSSMGTWAQQVAEPWLLLTLGASSFVIGLDSFAMNAPVWLLTLAGGSLADRADRRRVITVFQSIQMLCPTGIVVLLATGQLQVWMIIVFAVIVGVTDALSMPSFQSIVPSIVSREDIGRGLALNATQFNLSRILGPSLAGILMASVGVLACFVVSAVSYLPFIGVALWILPKWSRPPPRADAPLHRHPWSGMAQVLRQPSLRGALLTVLNTSLLCAPLMTFAPVMVKDVFEGDARHFSAALASFGVGGLLGATALLAIPPAIDRRWLSAGFAVLYAITVVLSTLTPWFWGLLVASVVAGAAMTVSNTAANALLQATTERHLLGRTVSLYLLAMRGGMSLGALATGATVGLLGVRHALLVNGGLALALQVVLSRFWLRPASPEPAHGT